MLLMNLLISVIRETVGLWMNLGKKEEGKRKKRKENHKDKGIS